MPRPQNRLVGQVFGYVEVTHRVGTIRVGERMIAMWGCRCHCGAHITLRTRHLHGRSSCGCMSRQERHGKLKWHRREHAIWRQIRQACSNPKDHRWQYCGAKGIRVCPQWNVSFSTFLKDMGRRPTRYHKLRRIDPTQDYRPGNVHWIKERGVARSKLLTQPVEMCGEVRTLAEWGLAMGLSLRLLRERVHRGWSVGKILKAK